MCTLIDSDTTLMRNISTDAEKRSTNPLGIDKIKLRNSKTENDQNFLPKGSVLDSIDEWHRNRSDERRDEF